MLQLGNFWIPVTLIIRCKLAAILNLHSQVVVKLYGQNLLVNMEQSLVLGAPSEVHAIQKQVPLSLVPPNGTTSDTFKL